MKRLSTTPAFLAGVAVAAAFILISSRGLPGLVASHFDGTGAGNGFMTRNGYVTFMLAVAAVLPVVIVFLPRLLRVISPQLLNVPNRDYWLVPERREQAYAYLDTYLLRFGWALAVFLCFVHWLVVAANEVKPPQLSNTAFIAGLVAFLIFVVAWIIAILGRFRRP